MTSAVCLKYARRCLLFEAVYLCTSRLQLVALAACRRSANVPPNAKAPRKLAPEITAEALDGDVMCGEVSSYRHNGFAARKMILIIPWVGPACFAATHRDGCLTLAAPYLVVSQ